MLGRLRRGSRFFVGVRLFCTIQPLRSRNLVRNQICSFSSLFISEKCGIGIKVGILIDGAALLL